MEKYTLSKKKDPASIHRGTIAILFFLFTLMLICPCKIAAQNNSIKGKIVDATTSEPLVGVTVSVKGVATSGTMTDIDGQFVLKVSNPNATLVVSYVGYKLQEIKAAGRTVIDVALEEDVKMLNEVQVVAFGQQKKVTVTGAISNISGKELLQTPTGSLTNALAGRVLGVSTVQYSGEPGADAASIFVRGIVTLSKENSAPLIQVDGVERDFNQIDPNEVESITILKDASATAVFGVRGANGVILVTTKRGTEGKAKISVSTYFGVQVPTRLLEFANSYQYATYYNEAQRNDGVTPDKYKFQPDALDAFKNHSNPLVYPDVDWLGYLLKDGAMQSQHNLNISGGTQNLRYFVSVGAFTQEGLFKTFDAGYDFNFDFNRYNYRTNLDFDVTKSTILSLNLGGRIEDKNTPISNEDQNQLFRHLYWATPFSGAGIVDGKWIKTNPDIIPSPGSDGLSPYYGKGYNSKVTNTLNVDLMLVQKLDALTKGLSFKIKGSYNSSYSQNKQRAASIAYYSPVINSAGGVDLRKSGDDGQLGYGELFGRWRDWYFETSVNYNRTFGDHNFGALALYNQSKLYYPKTFTDIPIGYVGFVGRVTYDYKSRYMAEFNAGYNGSENFDNGRRYGFFPAGSVGWIATEEDFMRDFKEYVSYLKLRVSYGIVGNDKMSGRRFIYLPDSYVLGGSGYNFGTNVGSNQPGAYEANKNNPFVIWENSFKQNYGLDFYTLKDRIKFTLDVFKEHRKNILVETKTLPGVIGITSPPPINKGIVDSHGYEISLGWEDKIGSDFRYWARTNLSFSRNKVLEMDEVRQNEDYLYQTGQPYDQPIIRKFWGFYDETSNERYKQQYGHDIAEHAGGLRPGDCVYVDINSDGVIDEDDRIPQGFTDVPEYVAGANLGFSWKGWEFSMQWNGAWNASRLFHETLREPMGDTNEKGLLLSQFEGRWTPEDPGSAKWPRPSISNKRNNLADSDLYLIDASYVRLKTIELGYTFKGSFLKKAKIASLRLYGNGYNLITIDKLKITDPESRTSDRPNYPLTKVYNIGMKIDF